MGEEMLHVTVSDGNNRQASGSGNRDDKNIQVSLGKQPWIEKGGNYRLSAGNNNWAGTCTDVDATYYHFRIH